jgi:thioredoxin reductase (NADPH)
VDRNRPIAGLKQAIDHGSIRYCPICDGFEVSDLRIGVLGPAGDAASKALFLRTYSKNIILLTLDGKAAGGDVSRFGGGIHPPSCRSCRGFRTDGRRMAAVMSNGSRESFDVIYPALGCDVRSQLGTKLRARHNHLGSFEVDVHQQTTLSGLYAVEDVVSDLHQIAVGTGHAAVAATHIHHSLPRNFR